MTGCRWWEASNSDVSEPPEPEASKKEQTERNSLQADETTRVEGIVLNSDNKPIAHPAADAHQPCHVGSL